MGITYVQYPKCDEPNKIFNHNMGFKCYWEELNFNGAFFRASGTGALLFNEGLQGESLPNIMGKITSTAPSGYPIIYEGGATAEGAFKSCKQETRWGGQANRAAKYLTEIIFNANDSSSIYKDGAEVIPKNYTIRIWKRIS